LIGLICDDNMQEEQALKSLIPDSAAICEQALRDAGIAPNAEATAAAAALPNPAVVEVPLKPPAGPAPAPAEKLQVTSAAAGPSSKPNYCSRESSSLRLQT